MTKSVKILGAGLSGLSCAINLVKKDVAVEVIEKRDSIGKQNNPNYQVLNGSVTPKEYLESLNLKPKYRQIVKEKCFFATNSRDFDFKLNSKVYFIQRGGPDSLEAGLYKQAVDSGVKFKFNTIAKAKEVDVIATGPKSVDAIAYGEVYEGVDFDSEHFYVMYDDKYSPRGWYLYAVPYDNKLAVMNCCSQPHVGKVKLLLKKAISEKNILKDAIGGNKPVSYMGGYGNVELPKSAVDDGRLILGEAAGFQDPFRGLGMAFALESGKLAADAITGGLDYDRLWKDAFSQQFKLDYSRRFIVSLFGSRRVDLMYRKYSREDTINLRRGDVGGPVGNILKTTFMHAELLKKKLLGYW